MASFTQRKSFIALSISGWLWSVGIWKMDARVLREVGEEHLACSAGSMNWPVPWTCAPLGSYVVVAMFVWIQWAKNGRSFGTKYFQFHERFMVCISCPFTAQWEHVMETCLGSWLKIVFLSGVFNVLKHFIKTYVICGKLSHYFSKVCWYESNRFITYVINCDAT